MSNEQAKREPRDCIVIVVCGKKRIGKSVETLREIYKYVNGNPQRGIPPRKALIFDMNNEFSDFEYPFPTKQNHNIKTIRIADVAKFSAHPKVEVRRIGPFYDDGRPIPNGEMQNVLTHIIDNYRGGLLLVEDLNKYAGTAMKIDVIGTLATCRHVGLDLIIHFQLVGRAATPSILGNTNFIRLHKTNDGINRHKNKFEDKYEIMRIAENLVELKFENGDIRFFVFVDVDNGIIKEGDYSREDAERAVQLYVTENFRSLIRPLMDQRNLDNVKLYSTEEEAIGAARIKILKKYFEHFSLKGERDENHSPIKEEK